MKARWLVVLSLVGGAAVVSSCASAGSAPAQAAAPSVSAAANRAVSGSTNSAYPERPVRRDIPMTHMIQRAFAAGTRDSTGAPGPNYWQLWMDYTIHARLDPATRMVTGTETAVIHNNSDTAMTAIQLRLDQNIFRANVPKLESVPEITDGMNVTKLTVNGKDVDLNPPRRRFRRSGPAPQPTLAVYGVKTTTARITLPDPIPAGGTATLGAEWSFEVSESNTGRGERMGAWGDSLFQVAQWYPRVAVFDDLRRWDTDPYLGPSEFYNNFGHFDVTLDVPAGWIVGATGVLQNPDQVLTATTRERLTHVLDSDDVRQIVTSAERGPGQATAAGDRLQWHFVADTAGDFAWATASKYQWDATRATLQSGKHVPINILYLPGDSARYVQAGPVVRHAIEFYSKLWMPYGFPQLTIVDGPEMGMEYPMFIMSGVGAADHETGHEWWPMMVGTNETWYGFMDEGFNQYMNILSRYDRQGQEPNLDGLGQRYGLISGSEQEAPLMWDANYGGPMYSFQAYGKAPLMLSMLGGIVGDTAVWRAMSQYAHEWRFKHPTPWDYAFAMDRALGRDLGWFWYYWLFTTDAVNPSIQDVTTNGAQTVVTVRQDGEMPSPVVLEVQFAPEGPPIRPMSNAVMKNDTTAIVTWPVDVWFGGSRTFKAVLDFGPRKIDRVIFDPHCRFPDNNPSDNIWPRSAAAAGGGGANAAMMAIYGGRGQCYGGSTR
jgi:hypothetical protein